MIGITFRIGDSVGMRAKLIMTAKARLEFTAVIKLKRNVKHSVMRRWMDSQC